MGTDEMSIYEFLRATPNDYALEREIARRASGKKRFREDPNWTRAILFRMVRDEILETDGCGQYRLKLREKDNSKPQKLTMENWETWKLVLEEQPDRPEARKDSK